MRLSVTVTAFICLSMLSVMLVDQPAYAQNFNPAKQIVSKQLEGVAADNAAKQAAIDEAGGKKPAANAPAKAATPEAAGAVVKESWDWSAKMREVGKKFTGTQGVVLFLGDSITYANPATAWGRGGQGQTDSDKAILKWAHATEGQKDTNGFYLASVDKPGNRSETAASGITVEAYLKGGFNGMASLAEILKKYNPQVVIILLGANDARGTPKPETVAASMKAIVTACIENGTIPVLQTITPVKGKDAVVKGINDAYLALAKELSLPIIDLHGEFLARQPGQAWLGTLVDAGDGIHLTAKNSSAAPTEENLKNSGYLLRCWLAVQKLKEVKEKAIDAK